MVEDRHQETRVAHGRHQRLLSLADRALYAGATWVQADPGQRYVPQDLLGIGPLATVDISQVQLWRDRDPQNVRPPTRRRVTRHPQRPRLAGSVRGRLHGRSPGI
ncbi:hypothetical protein LZG04_27795 [Saccharothrix sp. S26]|uniref:hypothetical protein n=1 Tax=Saccharothrix sp. S26 TaxID=2907215 RepID=UPI001F4473C2|nr:hypothetical protein [Saccharothrix sp. S26]MCE6998573.1 hypothetical protein [Saccharothrix sp. S26]